MTRSPHWPYDAIRKKLLRLVPNLSSMSPGDALTLKASGFMDLHIDVLAKDADWMRLSLRHSYEHNGDLMADPDMELRVSLRHEWPVAEALTYQQDSLGVYQVVHDDQGRYHPRLKKSLNAFLNQWLTNLLRQGHRAVAA